ncbi:phosphoribosylanthranilate isomerase [Amylibacter sp. SFDW26]|uniref:phosphoribosylanthranilate isomerase n=1 Tax=Amylibacter sp. SFDW26 TaxID=2652722 RepID=UPI001261F97D|nr:phosphoribosylanthranilate isomerase [Amylibacter sp. SFDW26]KAB7613368.1 phosphoribosylanthranilate isomerase [Amylibacter sp. SFDW26]
MSSVAVKICGLKTPETLQAAVDAGARYIGFNFFPKSPRYVTVEQAKELAEQIPMGVCKVALVVDATDDTLDAITASVPVDMLQLHGHETPERVLEIKERYGLPVMKVVGVATADDLERIDTYSRVADQILVDAKAPKNAVLPGGNGLPFDWTLIAQRRWAVPWMLAGGLTPENVAEAVKMTGAPQVDVASGVESAPGIKDVIKIAAFVAAAQGE